MHRHSGISKILCRKQTFKGNRSCLVFPGHVIDAKKLEQKNCSWVLLLFCVLVMGALPDIFWMEFLLYYKFISKSSRVYSSSFAGQAAAIYVLKSRGVIAWNDEVCNQWRKVIMVSSLVYNGHECLVIHICAVKMSYHIRIAWMWSYGKLKWNVHFNI